jgi:DNA replication and repair protein RecF
LNQPLVSPVTDIRPSVANRVRMLSLSHFRNYRSARLETDGECVVLLGPNGAGKTNALEAVSLLTPGRGFRRAGLSDIDNLEGGASWAVAAEIDGPLGSALIGTGRDASAEDATDKRLVKIDGKAAKSQSELARYFSVLWLTPQMDNLFIEGGSARRKFLDRLVFSFDAEHASRVNAYDFAMRERNRLLQNNAGDMAWIGALEQKMAEHGIAVAVARQHTAEGLNKAIMLSGHSFPKAFLSILGRVETMLAEGAALAAENDFREMLAASRGADARAGRALCGTHRSQIDVLHVDKQMPAERCSTGEQKAMLISIILAQARAGAAWHGRVPALLLDEVATHLDAQRRSELYAEITDIGAQAWLTGTDRETFDGFVGQYVKVENGLFF